MIQQFFQHFNIFSESEIGNFTALFERRTLNKNDFFVREGERCKEIAFIETGIFRSYYTSEDGKDMTYCFRFPNDLIASYSSFVSGEPSQENMQVISEAEILI